MKITRGKIAKAQKVVLYGTEGIGKSTFASHFPDPVYIDTEGSTNNMDVARLDKPSSWSMLLEEVDFIKRERPCKTLIIDTIDWAETLCIQQVCQKAGKKGIEDFGYGNGYVYVKEELGRFLDRLDEVIDAGINVVLLAHAQIRKFEQPDEMGAYDRYELKLGKKTGSQTAPLVKEWADMVLFANYRTLSIAVDDKGQKHKAQGGERVMYTQHHPCWDAKNRHGLEERLPFTYAAIAHIFSPRGKGEPIRPAEEPHHYEVQRPDKKPDQVSAPIPEPVVPEPAAEKKSAPAARSATTPRTLDQLLIDSKAENLPKALLDLMTANDVDEWELQTVVASKGYFPPDTPIENYDPDFIRGCLVGAWEQVFSLVKEIKQNESLPFN